MASQAAGLSRIPTPRVGTDYAFSNTLAPYLHDLGILCEPDCREPWSICEAHADGCLDEIFEKLEQAVGVMLCEHPALPGS
ncbi:MAG: hypothetical protein OEM03_07340 [Chromatiales bacterium]|nr:hypothetical protein [Chromatiales bacterium]